MRSGNSSSRGVTSLTHVRDSSTSGRFYADAAAGVFVACMIRFSCLSDNSWMPLELVSEYPHSRNLWKEFLLAITELRRFPTLLLAAVVMLFAFAAPGQEPPAPSAADPANGSVQANPGRPTDPTPTTLTPVGYVQLESGTLRAENSREVSNRT